MRFDHGGRRLSGVALPLSSLKTARSPGCGEYPDLEALGGLVASWNFNLVQLLPVNDSGSQTSPYSALSAFALHPLYLRIGDLPELAAKSERKPGSTGVPVKGAKGFAADAEALIARFAAVDQVPHEELLSLKLKLLERIWQARGAAAMPELDAFIEAHSWVRDYAAFVEAKRRNEGKAWWEWKSLREPTAEDIAALWNDPDWRDELRFHAWVQLRAGGQLEYACSSLAARGIAVMGDIPILMNEDSAEVWARRGLFRLGLIAGAPPDMYSELGQNWGFPIYDWDAIAAQGYAFWIERLREADRFYSSYRIDHVLGFFRIWALSDRERSGYLGRFVPDVSISKAELEAVGFDDGRLRWISQPHVHAWRLEQAAGEAAARGAANAALDRIGQEELFLFKRSIRGEKDIEALPGLSPAARDFLVQAWRDRVLHEFEEGSYAATWRHSDASAWPSLSERERESLRGLFTRKAAESERLWEERGRALLDVLKGATSMLPCAEDLGAVPDCVPRVLAGLGMLGLRVLRWTRRWAEAGQPYVPVAEYPYLSVACPSVHDSSSLREWWQYEAERERLWAMAGAAAGRSLGGCPERLDTAGTEAVLGLIARSASLFAVYPIQDLVALGTESRPADPRSERINVPGTVEPSNWRYLLPHGIEELSRDDEIAQRARRLAALR